MADNVAFGKDSIQLPYRRFLADSAAGFVAVGLVVLAYYAFTAQQLGASTEVKIFLLLILFLLATPVGFAANAISWIVLGNAVAAVERFCFARTDASSNVFVTSHVASARQMKTLTDRFTLNADNFRETGSLFRDLMESEILAKLSPPSNARELMIFLRSMALFALVAAMVALAATQTPHRNELTVTVGLTICIASSLRTTSGKLGRVLSPALAVAGIAGLVFLLLHSREPMLPVALIGISLLAVLVAGIVDYYHYSYVLLHTYFALEALGIRIDPSADRSAELLKAASALFAEATNIARREAAR